jgi:hypothetical protein
MGCLTTVALTLALWAGIQPPAYLVPVELYVNSQSSKEDKVVVTAFVRAMTDVFASSHLLTVAEPDILARPGTYQVHLALVVGDGKVVTSWEVWVVDAMRRRQQVWRSGLSDVDITHNTKIWRGKALVTRQSIAVAQALEQVELDLVERLKHITLHAADT